MHCLIMAQRQRLVNILSKAAPKGKGKQREARKKEPGDVQTDKGEKDEHLKLSTLPRTILFYKNYKKINK